MKDYFGSKGWLTRYSQADDSTGLWQKYVAEVQRSEMDNFNTPDLDQGADSILRPGETLEDAFDVTFRKANAEGGRQRFNKGLNVKPYLDQEQFVKEFTTQRIDGDKTTTEFVEYLNDNYKPSAQTDKFKIGNVDTRMRVLQEKGLIPKDAVLKGSKADLALTPEKYKSVLGEKEYNRIMKEDPTKLKDRYEYVRNKKNIPDFSKIRADRTLEKTKNMSDIEYEDKILKKARERNAIKRGNFPKFNVNRKDAKSMAWKDLVSRSYETANKDQYFKFETPLESGKNYNTADMKKIVLIDKNGNRFTYDTLFDDVKKIAGEAEFKNFKNTYDQRAFMNKEGITTELNKLYGNTPGSYKSVFNIQHIEGFNKNPFKIHMTFADQNLNEAYSRKTFTADFGKADTYSKKKNVINNYYKSLGPDIVAQIGKQPKGESKTLINLLDKTGIKLTDSQTTGAKSLDEIMETIGKTDPKLAKKVSIQLNSGLPVDQMLAEIKKIPGITKLGKGFMKAGGPFEVAFFGLDTFNEFSKGKTIKQSAKTALSNFTLGAYEGNKIEDMNVLIDTAKDLNIDSTGFNELRELQVLQNEINEDKKLLTEMAYFNKDQGGKSLTGSFDLKTKANDLTKLENEFASRSDALAENVDINSLVDNYTQTTKSLAQQQFDKSKESRSKRVYPEMGNLGSDISTTLANTYKSFLPQNLMETGLGPISNVTRPYVRAAQKIPFIGDYFKPTSDAAKLSAMNQEDRNKLLDEKTPSILENLQAPYFPKARGGIMSLTNKK